MSDEVKFTLVEDEEDVPLGVANDKYSIALRKVAIGMPNRWHVLDATRDIALESNAVRRTGNRIAKESRKGLKFHCRMDRKNDRIYVRFTTKGFIDYHPLKLRDLPVPESAADVIAMRRQRR